MYGKIILSTEVLTELVDVGTPRKVREWAQSRPEWLEIRVIQGSQPDPALERIDPGERAAILLAQGETDVLLLIDDGAGRAEANRRSIPNTDTLGVLRAAAIQQLLDLPSALAQLAATNFRVCQSLLDDLLAEDSERKRQPDA